TGAARIGRTWSFLDPAARAAPFSAALALDPGRTTNSCVTLYHASGPAQHPSRERAGRADPAPRLGLRACLPRIITGITIHPGEGSRRQMSGAHRERRR